MNLLKDKKRVLVITEIPPEDLVLGGQIRFKYIYPTLQKCAEIYTVFLRHKQQTSSIDISKLPGNYQIYHLPKPKNIILRAFNAVFQYLFVSSAIKKHLHQLIIEFKPELAWIDAGFDGQYIRFFKKLHLPVIYNTHNVESDLLYNILKSKKAGLFQSLRSFLFYYVYALNEKHYISKADSIIVVSEIDRKKYIEIGFDTHKMHIVPNTVNEKDFTDIIYENPCHEFFCLFAGTFDTFPNIEGFEFMIEHVWPAVSMKCPDLSLIIAGRNAKTLYDKYPEIYSLQRLLIKNSPEIMTPFFQHAEFTIAPIFTGSGTRGKAIESLMCGKPVIGTTKGLEGLGLIDGENAVIANSAEEFIKGMVDMHTNKRLREMMGKNGRTYVIEKFSTNSIEKVIVQLIDNTIRQNKSHV
jgi:glycosyltransferase involved in cell wall biosynthesis